MPFLGLPLALFRLYFPKEGLQRLLGSQDKPTREARSTTNTSSARSGANSMFLKARAASPGAIDLRAQSIMGSSTWLLFTHRRDDCSIECEA